MEEKRFALAYEQGNWWAVRDGDITLWKEEVIHLLNEQQDTIQSLKEELKLEQDFASRWQKESEMLAKENEQLRTQLLLCQQSKDGRFQVWEVPPITMGRRISFSTNGDKKK